MARSSVVSTYLEQLDAQREAAFASLDGLSEDQIWQRPAPKEWSIGEILDHNYLLILTAFPFVGLAWQAFGWLGRRNRARPYQTSTHDVYRTGKFPMWVGFLWTPRYNPRRRVPLETLQREVRSLHTRVRAFYQDKDEDVLGNVYLYDPLIGRFNLIVTLQVGVHHDQLHWDDVIALAARWKT